MHMDESLARRFERSVDRTGDHHLWTGALDNARGTGRLKVDGRTLTAHRVAWEIAHGLLPVGARVATCPDNPLCVRLEHLAVTGSTQAKPSRNRKGGGSMRELRPGVWKLAATSRFADGTSRRVHRTIRANGRTNAAKQLAAFVDEVANSD